MSYITSYPVHNEFYSYKRVTKMAHIYNKDRERDSYDQWVKNITDLPDFSTSIHKKSFVVRTLYNLI